MTDDNIKGDTCAVCGTKFKDKGTCRKCDAEENKPKNSNVDEAKLRDIELTVANDEPFYRQHHQPWVKNFMRKRASKKQTFDIELAHKGIKLYYVKDALIRYNELNDTHLTLNKEEKDVLVKTFLENVLDDVKSNEDAKIKPNDI